MNAERFRTNVFISVLLGALGLCVALFWPFWPALAWAVVLAILIYPTHRRIAARLRGNGVAAAISTALTVGLIVLPLLLLLAAVTAQGREMVEQAVVALKSEPGQKGIPAAINGVLTDVSEWLGRNGIETSPAKIREFAQKQLTVIGSGLAGNAAEFLGRLAKSFIQVGLALVTLFFLLKDGSRLLPAVKAFIPLSSEQTDEVLSKAVETMYATFYGVVLVAVFQGVLGGIGFWIVGLPSPLLWGVVMTALCMIPLAGAPIVWIPGVLVLLSQGLYWQAVVLGLWGWGVVGFIDNITRPFIIGGRTSLHPLAVFFAILGGIFAVGAVGVFLGPVLLAVTLALLDILRLKLSPTPPGSPPPPPAPEETPPSANVPVPKTAKAKPKPVSPRAPA